MKTLFKCGTLLLFVLIAVSGDPAAAGSFMQDPYWNSGKAEFQVYKASIGRYGIQRDARAKIIIVKEPFDGDKLVKTVKMSEPEPLDVMKMNYIQTVPTGVYDYSQMASVFFDRATGRLLKFTMSSQDGCGQTYMKYVYENDKHKFDFHSYFDDEGDLSSTLDAVSGPIAFYDALPLMLRFRLQEKMPYRLAVIPALINSKYTKPALMEATVTNSIIDGLTIGNHIYHTVVRATVEMAGKKDVYYFEPDFPFRLVQLKKNNGDELTLTNSHFFNYWEHTGPEDSIEDLDGRTQPVIEAKSKRKTIKN